MNNLTTALMEGFGQGMSHTATTRLLCDMLQQVEGNPLAFAGSWHPYGFLVILLTNEQLSSEVSHKSRLRLHIWPDERRIIQTPYWPVHYHTWFLHSRILCGAITDSQYRVEPTSEATPYRLYIAADRHKSTATKAQKVPSLQVTDVLVTCQRISEMTYTAGQDYTIPPYQYHSSEVDEEVFASTLVLMRDPTYEDTHVVGELGFPNEYFYERRRCDLATFSALIAKLHTTLSNQLSQNAA